MNGWFKRLSAVCLMILLVTVLAAGTASASGESPATTDRAEKLTSLNLFRGTGTAADGSPIYNLNAYPTRLQGLIMLTRLLGVEDEALAFDGSFPFNDVTDGAPYVAYAWWNGITNGTSPFTFNPDTPLTAKVYVTFLLRALGYNEEDGDFQWGEQFSLASSLNMMTAAAGVKLDKASFNRGDMVDLSYAALSCRVKGSTMTLAEKLSSEGVFTRQAGQSAGVIGSTWIYDYVPYDDSTVTYASRRVSTSAGAVTAHVVTVNTANPDVTVKAALVNDRLGDTAPFQAIVDSSGADVVINGNFFLSGADFKTPIGHLMTGGKFLYGNSGISSLGITDEGSVSIGRPSVFTRLKSGNNEWSVYEINTAEQNSSDSVMYTPAYGSSVTTRSQGWALTAARGVITEFYFVSAGAVLSIPANGFVVLMGIDYASTEYFRIPQIGSSITTEYYLRHTDNSGFSLNGMESIVSGAPRLVQNGEIVTTLEPGFTETRFTTQSSPRTAVGIDSTGKLLLVCVPGGATIGQMRELMLNLGCVDAFNLDGGASCGMYYRGQYIATPGRELTVTLQVFDKS